MEKKSFFQTKEGGLTVAFIAIIIAFAIIMAGLGSANNMLCLIGFAIIVIAMLYSPFKVYVFDRLKKNK
ncbi:hypothetical protein NE683_18640 [Bariatricus massiliensis]|uniref:Uncharacterized protein n=1 Tax=Bariatricus massiliensis TaxID=1745713 RepID=A0ABS8DKZ9_9FIRM|nr:hypothetical protein [Bariatricus massiliensis]MCB7305979.1 hypothetical protein [Bariatricus massiliensis]MCB7374671.1 hypothetical protein [Bariatricus massiliensis]MCB7389122.1 hypothetical protein [Bariatricus massiliensis]MCB7413295.1 hypothetical protein [Bariatricus massiliensis]MCQ5255243.1 hypothetical protein [Bariatricus massiliensis]